MDFEKLLWEMENEVERRKEKDMIKEVNEMLYEFYSSLVEAGFSSDEAIKFIVAMFYGSMKDD